MKTERKSVLGLAFLAPVLVLAPVLLLGGCLTLTRPALPQVRGSVVAEGLNDQVEIHRDSVGVAHIIASSDEDVFFAQGYVHAQERFYQMEFWRRVGAGRLSELFGDAVLASDIYLRTMGFRRVAEQVYADAPPLLKTSLDAYAAGVNAYITDMKPRKLAAEFALLGLQGLDMEIEPWTPLDSLTWPMVMSQDVGVGVRHELLRLDMIRAVGLDMTKDYFTQIRYDQVPTTIHPEDLAEANSDSNYALTPEADFALFDDPEWTSAVANLDLNSRVIEGADLLVDLMLGGSPETGSNQWVVSGQYTESGLPIFSNDPHLGLQMPSIWYEISLHVTGNDGWSCQGFSFAGMPGIVIGHNDFVIWGMSTANPDVQDLYVERINPENPDEYLVGDQWVSMETRQEIIQIDGEDPYFLTVRETRNGPIVTDHGGEVPYSSYDVRPVDLYPTDLKLTELSLKWTALEPTFPLYAVLLYNRARNFDEFREALRHFHVPSHNYLYADVEGNIAYVHPGNLPIRGQGVGSLPVPGWDDTYQWQGYIPYDELPVVLKPDRGYLVNANNPIMPEGGQKFAEHLYESTFRAIRAEELVTAAMADGDFAVDEHIAIQLDTKNQFAAMILPYILAVDESTIRDNVDRESRLLAPEVDTDEEEEELAEKIEERIEGALAAMEILSDWDLMMDVDSIGATVFAQFYVDLCYKTYGDQIPEAVWDGSWGTTSGYRLRNSLLWPLAEEPDNAWWDDKRTLDVAETRDDIMARVLSSAYETLVEDLGDNTNKWEWGEVHTIEYRNATLGESGIGFVENIFNRGPEPVSGGLEALRCAEFRARDSFGVYHIASMRMIADLSDWSSTLWVHSPGQSGHPASKHYNDSIDEWIEGEYFTHPWTLEDIRDQSQQSLLLEPME